jgi:hypothetical protein
VARLLNGEAEQVDDLLRALEDRELVASRVQSSIAGDREYMFKHILTRDVAYESLPRRDRGVAHATIAGWLEDVVGERKREFSELLAYHYLEAHRSRGTTGDGDLRAKAFEFLLLAADDARTKLVLAKARKLGADALDLAESPEQQAIVHELLGRVHLDDYNGDNAWYHWRTAADLRMSHVTEDAKSIARTCGLAIELPMRWPGAMGTVPEEKVVLPYLQGGLDRAGTEDSPELLRLLAMQCFWPFAYPDSKMPDVRAVTRAAGERALEMAKRLRMPVMQSATLDGLASHTMIEGIYGPSVAMNEERRSLLPYLHDPLEVGDVKAVLAWTFHHVGRYAESEREASEGYARTASESLGGSLHCLSWLGVTRARLGKWDELLEDLEAARTILGERRDHPPGFALRLYGAAGLVNEVRGDQPAADRCIRAVLEGTGATTLEAGQSSYGAVGWIALTYTRRGQFDLARAWLDKQDDSSFKGNAGLIWEARTDLVADAGWWDQAPEVVEHARAHAKEAGLIALPVFADRLEGRTAVAGGDLERGLEVLAKARDGFERLEARWDQALTALYRAEALAAAGRPADKNGDLTLARATFERLGARRELQRANALT